MKRRVFIGIRISPSVKKKLSLAIKKWESLPVRWVREDNFHLTLVFLGFVAEDVLPEICEKIEKASKKKEIFDVDFQRIGWFPEEKNPKLVALIGENNKNLLELLEKLEKELGIFSASKKTYRPHITLGKGRRHKWEALAPKPTVDQKFSLAVPIDSIELMESVLENGQLEYITLENFPLT